MTEDIEASMNSIDLNEKSYMELSKKIASSIISLKVERKENLKEIEVEKNRLSELRNQLLQIQNEMNSVSKEISRLQFNKKNINRDINSKKRKSYKLNRMFVNGTVVVDLEEFTKKGKRKQKKF